MNKEISSNSDDEKVLIDTFSRSISYLRLSLTDRCNLRCMYCVTEDETNGCLTKLGHEELLSYEELLRVVRIAVEMGISKLRLTGGEPLVRRHVMNFIERLAGIRGLDDIRITTNGVLLAGHAQRLFDSGVTKVNVSLDTLQRKRFTEITGVDCYDRVWEGINRAEEIGFAPIKLNMVVMRHINDDELEDFARLSLQRPFQVRFIEFMPIGTATRWREDTYMPSDEILQRISRVGELIPQRRMQTDGPAKVYRLGKDARGTLGVISPISHHFCDQCNRLRLTSAGSLRSCLLHDRETDLRAILRASGTDADIRQALVDTIRHKPQRHKVENRLQEGNRDCHGRMSRIGG